MLIASGMICSCQKQDALAEAQLAQRKTELDTREETLIQREKAADEREKAVAEREIEAVLCIRYPSFDPIPSDPRYAQFMRQLGLPQ